MPLFLPANGWRHLPLLLLASSCCSCCTCSRVPKARPMAALLLLLPSSCRCFFFSCYCCCCTRCCFAAAAAAAAPTAPPLLPPLAPCVCLVCSPSLPTKGQPLKGRVPPGLGLSPLWTPTQVAAPFHMENGDGDVKCFILGKPLK